LSYIEASNYLNILIVKKRVIIKNRLCLFVLCIAAVLLSSIFVSSIFRNFIADFYYQKYINTIYNSTIDQQFEYISKMVSLNETNPEYLYEFGKLFYEANWEKYLYANVDSSLIGDRDENRLLLQSFLKVADGNPKLIPIVALKESIRHNPLNSEVYLELALMYATLEHTENIDLLFKRAIIMDPSNIFLHYYIGIYSLGNQNLEKALDEFRKVFVISNSSGIFLSNLFLNIVERVYLFNSGYYTLAKINPSSYKALSSLANFLRNKNRWGDSKKAFYRSIKLAPTDKKVDIIYKFAAASASNKDWQELNKINEKFNNCISANKEVNKSFNLLLIRSSYSQKDYVEVLKRAELLIESCPYDYQPYYYKGLSLLRLGRKGEGFYNLEKAAKLSPENIGLHRTLAFSYESVKQYDGALAKWKLVLELAKANGKNEKQYSDALDNIVRIKTKLEMSN